MATRSPAQNSFRRRAFGSALIFRNKSKPDSDRTLALVRSLLRARGVRCREAGEIFDLEAARRSDFAIVLGGDGTMLRAAAEIAPIGIPLLGVNIGGLGFLSSIDAAEFKRRVDAVLAGRFAVEERSMLSVEVLRRGRRLFGPQLALNEVVIRCGDQARAITLGARSSERFIADYFGDGLIVATPTGSTAYALAASGPIVLPSLDVTVVAPICPHTLAQRPLILPGHLPLEVRVGRRRPDERPRALTSLDGKPGCELRFEDEVRVRRAEAPLRLLLPSGRSFFDVLRRKLKWGQR